MAQSLYERLGKAQGIAAIANDVVDLHLVNPKIKTRFVESDTAKLKQLAAEFFCAGSGGPESYSGKDMRAAHLGMNISEEEYLTVLDDIMAAMAKHNVGQTEVNEVLGILYSLKGEIIRV